MTVVENKFRKSQYRKFLHFFKSASNPSRPSSWWRSPTSADVWSPRPVSVTWIASPPWSSSPPPRSKCPSKERIKTTLSTTHPLWFDCWQTGARAFDSVNPLKEALPSEMVLTLSCQLLLFQFFVTLNLSKPISIDNFHVYQKKWKVITYKK